MSNLNSLLINQLQEIIVKSIESEMWANGVFYSERLLCEVDCEEVRYLLSKCYIGEGKYHKAFAVLKDCLSEKCRYQLAIVCLKLNKLIEAEKSILGKKGMNYKIDSDEIISEVICGAYGFYLLGIVNERLGKIKEAVSAFSKSLEINPFMWCSFEKLCKFSPLNLETEKFFSDKNIVIKDFFTNQSVNLALTKDFSLSPEKNQGKLNSNNNLIFINQSNHNISNLTEGGSKFHFLNSSDRGSNLKEKSGINRRINSREDIESKYLIEVNYSNEIHQTHPQTNMTPIISKDRQESDFNHPPNIKQKDQKTNFINSSIITPNQLFTSNNPKNKRNNFSSSMDDNSNFESKFKIADNSIKPFSINSHSIISEQSTPYIQKNYGSNNLRKEDTSDFQNNANKGILNTNLNLFSDIHINQSNANSIKKNQDSSSANNYKYKNPQIAYFNDLCSLIKLFADIYLNFCQFNCKESIELIKTLPSSHYNSGWALSLLGRCYFEQTKYKESVKYFQECFKLEPYRLEGLEFYSSCLWHLQDLHQLCNLASSSLDQSHYCPETWIVVGNCYSLQKEHETAIRLFQRAIQISPIFSYAYTLCAHEYCSTESFPQAKAYYKDAIAYDDRHYNAWWGLGNIFSKEHNYSEAIRYFKKATSINPKSAVLFNYLAIAYQNNKQLRLALNIFEQSEMLDPTNPMTKYQKANVFFSMKQYNDALNMLLEMNQIMPNEAPIHILIGRIYKMLKNFSKALLHFNTALDIDPKDSNTVKALIEKLYSSDENNRVDLN